MLGLIEYTSSREAQVTTWPGGILSLWPAQNFPRNRPVVGWIGRDSWNSELHTLTLKEIEGEWIEWTSIALNWRADDVWH